MAERVGIPVQPLPESARDDYYPRRIGSVAEREVAAAQQWNAQRLEVLRRRAAHVRDDGAVVVPIAALTEGRPVPSTAVNRRRLRSAHTADTGNRLDGVFDLVKACFHLRGVRVARAPKRHAEGQQIVRVEAGRHRVYELR